MNRNYSNCNCGYNNNNTSNSMININDCTTLDTDAICRLDCRQLKQLVMELGFTVVDLTMYLDTHPDDIEALAYFKRIKTVNQLVRKEYNEKCGPLTADMAGCDDYFNWVAPPMPWENC